jgi:hypothetical protein
MRPRALRGAHRKSQRGEDLEKDPVVLEAVAAPSAAHELVEDRLGREIDRVPEEHICTDSNPARFVDDGRRTCRWGRRRSGAAAVRRQADQLTRVPAIEAQAQVPIEDPGRGLEVWRPLLDRGVVGGPQGPAGRGRDLGAVEQERRDREAHADLLEPGVGGGVAVRRERERVGGAKVVMEGALGFLLAGDFLSDSET